MNRFKKIITLFFIVCMARAADDATQVSKHAGNLAPVPNTFSFKGLVVSVVLKKNACVIQVLNDSSSAASSSCDAEQDAHEQRAQSLFDQATMHIINKEYIEAFLGFQSLTQDETIPAIVRARSYISLGKIYQLGDYSDFIVLQNALNSYEKALDLCTKADASLYQDIQKNIRELNELISTLDALPLLEEEAPLAFGSDSNFTQHTDSVEEPVTFRRSKRNRVSSSERVPVLPRTVKKARTQNETFYCAVCEKSITREHNYRKHLQGKAHLTSLLARSQDTVSDEDTE